MVGDRNLSGTEDNMRHDEELIGSSAYKRSARAGIIRNRQEPYYIICSPEIWEKHVFPKLLAELGPVTSATPPKRRKSYDFNPGA